MSFVYFAERADRPGQIKIGYTKSPKQRASIGRFTIIATIPGGRGREAALHWAFRADCIEGEWFKRTPLLDETITECMAHGDCAWLDVEPPLWTPGERPGRRLLDEARAMFGTQVAASFALGYRHANSLSQLAWQPTNPPVLWGRLAIARAAREGRLPDALTAANDSRPSPSQRAA